jgi:hypothetical protein
LQRVTLLVCSAYVSQHTSAYVSIRQHTSAHASRLKNDFAARHLARLLCRQIVNAYLRADDTPQ